MTESRSYTARSLSFVRYPTGARLSIVLHENHCHLWINLSNYQCALLNEEAARHCAELVRGSSSLETPAPSRRRVIIESPYAGEFDDNVAYARACMHDSLTRNEAPIASHLLYTQPGVLDDKAAEQREIGISSGLTWASFADATVVYTDLGISSGMQRGIAHAQQCGRPIEYRTISVELQRPV